MLIKNPFYENPKLHKTVSRLRRESVVIPRYYGGIEYEIECEYITKYNYSIDLPAPAENTEECINKWVDHCILVYMLDHSLLKTIDTTKCVLDRKEMARIILYGEFYPEYSIRGLKYVEDMIDLVNFILSL